MGTISILWDIICMSASSLIWGILIAVVCMSLFFFIIRGWWKDALFTVWTYVIGAFLFLHLVLNCTILVGSIKILDLADEYQLKLTQIVNTYYDEYDTITEGESVQVIDELLQDQPLLHHYISWGSHVGQYAKDLPASWMGHLRSTIRSLALKTTLWCVLVSLVAGVLGILSLDKNYSKSSRRPRPSAVRNTHYSSQRHKPVRRR